MTESIRSDDLPASPAYSRILAALTRQGGLTREELSRVAYVGMTTLSGGGYLQRLRQQGLIDAIPDGIRNPRWFRYRVARTKDNP
jgi:hypothetical protein